MVIMVGPSPVPRAATALRPTWAELPGAVRRGIQDHLGSTVIEARSQGSGFTPGFASRLRLANGRRCFVKAASSEFAWMAAAYREEATKRALLPAVVPAPRLETTLVIDHDQVGGLDHAWVVLVFEDIDGEPPVRPWTPDQAASALRATTAMSRALTPAPSGYPWQSVVDDLGRVDLGWSNLSDHPESQPQLDDLMALTNRAEQLLAGDTLVHLDLRDDNMIIDHQGHAWVCDWNFPALGPIWADTVCIAISMQGDGLDGEGLLAGSPLITEEDREGIDCLLALLTAYFLTKGSEPALDSSPYLRTHQQWYGQVTGNWLRARRWKPAPPVTG